MHQHRLDEIGSEEKLPLPEWEWDYNNSTSNSGNGSGGGTSEGHGGHDGGAGGGSGGVDAERRPRSSVDAGSGAPSAKHVHARVSAEGRTRVLLVSSHKDIRRTISTFGAREAALVRQEWRARLVLEKYRG